MKIAVASNGLHTDSIVAERFADARWLLIVDMEQRCICEAVEKRADDPQNREFANVIADRNCESVICGEIEKVPFEILAENGITRSYGSGLSVTDALNCEAMLELITDYIGGPGRHPHAHEHENGP